MPYFAYDMDPADYAGPEFDNAAYLDLCQMCLMGGEL